MSHFSVLESQTTNEQACVMSVVDCCGTVCFMLCDLYLDRMHSTCFFFGTAFLGLPPHCNSPSFTFGINLFKSSFTLPKKPLYMCSLLGYVKTS